MDKNKLGYRSGIGSFLLGLLDTCFSTIRQLDWIKNKLPDGVQPMISIWVAIFLTGVGIALIWKFRNGSDPEHVGHPPSSVPPVESTAKASGENSSAQIADASGAGSSVRQEVHHHHNYPAPTFGPFLSIPPTPTKPKSPESRLRYVLFASGGQWCFEGHINRCDLQVLEIMNFNTAVPRTLRNVVATIDYSRAEENEEGSSPVLIVDAATWKNTNLGDTRADTGGARLTNSINLEAGETQSLIISFQRESDGAVFASPKKDCQYQQLDPGHWDLYIEVKADNTSPINITGGFTVVKDGLKYRLIRDMPIAFKQLD